MAMPLYPFAGDSGWGYCNQRGETVVASQFKRARWFNDGLALVTYNDGTWQFIDSGGRVTIDVGSMGVDVDAIRDFQGSRAVFRSGKLYGAMSRTGATIVEPEYDELSNFSNRHAVGRHSITKGLAEVDDYVLIDDHGKKVRQLAVEAVLDCYDDLILARDGVRYTFRDYGNRILLDSNGPSFKRFGGARVTFSRARGGIAPFALDGELWGAVNIEGRIVVSPKYDFVSIFHEGLAAAKRDGRWGFVESAGRELVTPQFDECGDFASEFAWVRQKSQYWFLDKQGSKVIGPEVFKQSMGRNEAMKINDTDRFRGELGLVHVGGEFHSTEDGPQYWKGGCWWYVSREGIVVRKCRDDAITGLTFGREI